VAIGKLLVPDIIRILILSYLGSLDHELRRLISTLVSSEWQQRSTRQLAAINESEPRVKYSRKRVLSYLIDISGGKFFSSFNIDIVQHFVQEDDLCLHLVQFF
jgi:hypothetical protein